MTIAQHMLDNHDKRPAAGEIIVILFEQCNLSCSFCHQKHDDKTGMDSIVDKVDLVRRTIPILRKKGKTQFSVHVMGGELFADDIPDELFEKYDRFIDGVRELRSDGTQVDIYFVSNLIFDNRARMETFLDKHQDVHLLTSFDFAGRFNEANKKIYFDNVLHFEDRIDSVNVILSKQNIERMIKQRDPVFDYLYDKFEVVFDYYGPKGANDPHLPTDVQLRQGLIYLFDNYPKVMPVANFTSKTKTVMSCMDTYTAMPNGKVGGCGMFENTTKVIPIKRSIEQKWFDSYNCFECEHFQRCSFGCFMSNHINDMRTQQQCWLKEVYDYVDTKEKV